MNKSRKLAYLAILSNVLIWGAAMPVVKPALSYMTPYNFLLMRYIVAAIFMLPALYAFWPKHLSFKQLLSIIGFEFLSISVSLSILYQGLALTSALSASFISSTAPFFVTLGGILFLKEHEETHEWLGLGLSMAGTVVILLASFFLTGALGQSSLTGNLLVGLYVLIDVAYLLIAKNHYQNLNKAFITAVSCLIGLISFAVIAPLMGPITPLSTLLAHPETLRAIYYMGILGSPVAVGLYLWGQGKIEASEASIFTYLQPLVYIPLTYLMFREKPLLVQIIGLILVALGVYLSARRPKKTKA